MKKQTKPIAIRIEHDTDLDWIAESLNNGEWEIVEGQHGKYSGYTYLEDLYEDIRKDKSLNVSTISITGREFKKPNVVKPE